MSALPPNVIRAARKVIEARWLPDRIPEGWPPFDYGVSDGCTGVRQIAQVCCVVHDADYHYGKNPLDKLLADYRLMLCIWKTGLARGGHATNPEPWSTMPAWVMLGVGRFIGVTIGGWKPFYRHEYKRKGWKPPPPPPAVPPEEESVQ